LPSSSTSSLAFVVIGSDRPSESLDQLQLRLEDEAIAAAEVDRAVPPSDSTAAPKGVPKRKSLSAHLPRQEDPDLARRCLR